MTSLIGLEITKVRQSWITICELESMTKIFKMGLQSAKLLMGYKVIQHTRKLLTLIFSFFIQHISSFFA